MDLTPFIDQLRRDLAAAADTGTDAVRTAAGHLAAALDPAARIVLLDALVSAADELTSGSDVVVDVRLRGREVELALQHTAPPPPPEPPTPPGPPVPPSDFDEGTSRVSLRLPETLKSRAEEAAASDGMSLNTWLVRAAVLALDGGIAAAMGVARRRGNRLSGWANS
jgi:hypothetical protein